MLQRNEDQRQPADRQEASLQGLELGHRIIDVLVDRLAENVVLLDLTHLAAFADYFVIATVDNERQMRAVVDAVDEFARSIGRRAVEEGTVEGGWVLIDLDEVVVHVFALEQRVYYDLETLWSHAHEVVRVQ